MLHSKFECSLHVCSHLWNNHHQLTLLYYKSSTKESKHWQTSLVWQTCSLLYGTHIMESLAGKSLCRSDRTDTECLRKNKSSDVLRSRRQLKMHKLNNFKCFQDFLQHGNTNYPSGIWCNRIIATTKIGESWFFHNYSLHQVRFHSKGGAANNVVKTSMNMSCPLD